MDSTQAREMLLRLAEISKNLSEVASLVAWAAFAASFASGLLLLQIMLRAKDARNFH